MKILHENIKFGSKVNVYKILIKKATKTNVVGCLREWIEKDQQVFTGLFIGERVLSNGIIFNAYSKKQLYITSRINVGVIVKNKRTNPVYCLLNSLEILPD